MKFDTEMLKLKSEKGEVVEVWKGSCYEPHEDGSMIAAIGGFSYFWGKPTNDPVTHEPNDDPNLLLRGGLVPIDKKLKIATVPPLSEPLGE